MNITKVLWYEDYHTVNSQTLQIFLFITINLMLSSRNLNCLRYDDYLTKILSLVFKYHMHLTESSFLKNVMLQFYMSSPTFSYISCPRYFSDREISIRKCTLKSETSSLLICNRDPMILPFFPSENWLIHQSSFENLTGN